MIDDSHTDPVVELLGVRPDNSDTAPLDLKFGRGELTFIAAPWDSPRSLIADFVHGTTPPPIGQVLFEGVGWHDRSIREIESARLSIGRVYRSPTATSTWIQNLSVSDNVMLAQQFCPTTNRAIINQRADDIANRFGLASIPTERPSVTAAEKLALAQWVRAFLPDPLRLLILEFPSPHVREESLIALVGAVTRAREDGASILWIGEPSDRLDPGSLSPSHTFIQSSNGLIKPIE